MRLLPSQAPTDPPTSRAPLRCARRLPRRSSRRRLTRSTSPRPAPRRQMCRVSRCAIDVAGPRLCGDWLHICAATLRTPAPEALTICRHARRLFARWAGQYDPFAFVAAGEARVPTSPFAIFASAAGSDERAGRQRSQGKVAPPTQTRERVHTLAPRPHTRSYKR